MARTQLFLKSDDLFDTGCRVGHDNPVLGEAFNAELARRALDDRVRPPEVHTLECLNKGIARRADGLLGSTCDKYITKEGDLPFALSRFSARLPIHAEAGYDLREACGRPNEPGVSQASGALNRRLRPGAKPDGRPRSLPRARCDRDTVQLIMPYAVCDILFRPEPLNQRGALLQPAAALPD